MVTHSQLSPLQVWGKRDRPIDGSAHMESVLPLISSMVRSGSVPFSPQAELRRFTDSSVKYRVDLRPKRKDSSGGVIA